ncbi:MAG: hypothetical protein AAB578_08270 [Elusimicrobiota bacterium]
MGPPLIRSIRFLDHPPEGGAGCAQIRVEMEDGSASTFTVSTPEDVAGRMSGKRRDSLFMEPVVFVRSLEEPVVREAVEAMAAEMGGYWLRYYNRRVENSPKKRPRR